MFFHDHRRFLETSSTASHLGRLNLRHHAMIEQNADILRDARVLDIASHDGRWSFAALKAGATHVTGIEGRPELVENARDNLKHYGVPETSFDFIAGDVFDVLGDDHGIMADVVMCLGFLYHTLRYPELFKGIQSTGATHLILDTAVMRSPDRVLRLRGEDVTREANATDSPLGHQGKVLTGRPSRTALEFMLNLFGFEVVKKFDWNALLKAREAKGVKSYRTRRRVTWVARPH